MECQAPSGVESDMTQGHTITVTPADLHVEVSIDGVRVAAPDRPVLREEPGLPPRYYLPREDVRADVLSPTKTETVCPFKGQASYWNVEIDGEVYDDLVWSYETPIPQAEGVAGAVSFSNQPAVPRVPGRAARPPPTPR